MLAKTADKNAGDWDQQLPYVLFAYRASQQESTKESPFFLLYGRDPQLPTEAALSADKDRLTLELKEYGIYVSEQLTEAWNVAKRQVAKAQLHQKRYHYARPPKFTIGNRVFLFKPAEKRRK